MTDTPDEVVDRYLDRLAAGDIDAVVGCFADDVEFLIPHAAGVPWLPDTSGIEAARTFFGSLADHLQSELFRVDGRVTAGADVALRGELRSVVRSTGGVIESRFAVWLTVADGRIVRYHLYEDSFAAARAAGLVDYVG